MYVEEELVPTLSCVESVTDWFTKGVCCGVVGKLRDNIAEDICWSVYFAPNQSFNMDFLFIFLFFISLLKAQYA